MERLVIALLYIPYFLIRIGDSIRSLLKIVINVVIIIKIIFVNFAVFLKLDKIIKPYPQKTKKVIYKCPKPIKITFKPQMRKNIQKLPEVYFNAFIAAIKYFLPDISDIQKNFHFINLPKIRIIQKVNSVTHKLMNIGPKATKDRPLIIYPPIILLAWRIKWFFTGVTAAILFILLPFVFLTWLYQLPNPTLLSRRDLEVATKIFDRNNNLLYEIYSEQNRTPVSLDEIPNTLKQATIAIEDKSFYAHQGFSLSGIARAIREIIINKKIQGGSTITQQLIKSALLSPEVSLTRKIRELVLALWAEQIYSKNQILEMYLNQVPYGGTAWGVEAASQTYFGKNVHQLTLAESALLAGLPAAPTLYSPFGSNPNAAFNRQHEVLKRMRADGYITQKQMDDALTENLEFKMPRISIVAPHFVMFVKDILEYEFGSRMIEKGGLRVKTSLDTAIQTKAQDIVTNHIDSLQNLNVGNGAALITNPQTGEILAMVGSRDYFDNAHDGNVNITTRRRQPGSSIKVINYALALENKYTAASLLEDTPVSYIIPGSPSYTPVNYDGRYHGIIPLRYALANSYNVPAVKLLAKLGVNKMVEMGRSMGVTSWEDSSRFGLSLTLGAGEVTMLDMARVYGTLANSGRTYDLKPILEITDYSGKVWPYYSKPKYRQSISPQTAFIISDILSDNQARTPAFGSRSSLVIDGKTVAVKTGTTNEKRDNWTIGYTPDYLTVVWVGNNDNSPMNQVLTSGVTGASPIWHDIMTNLTINIPDKPFPKPDNIVEIPCYYNRNEYFTSETVPKSGRCIPLPAPSPSQNP